MPDETSGSSGQEPTNPQGQAPTTPALTLEQALDALAATRREAATHRTKLAAFEKAQQDAETARLSELDQAKKRASDLESENARIAAEAQAALTTARIERTAAQLGIVDPEVAARLIDAKSIVRDTDGNPTNLDALLKALLVAKPYLAAQTAAQPGAAPTNPARGHAAGNLTMADVKKMSPAQINARWSEVSKVLAGG